MRRRLRVVSRKSVRASVAAASAMTGRAVFSCSVVAGQLDTHSSTTTTSPSSTLGRSVVDRLTRARD
jgi:hypothetical protein